MKENNIEKLVGENLNFVKSVANKYVVKVWNSTIW